MAMQTGISSSKVLILVGAGLTSSIILRNGRLSEVLSEIQDLIKGINEVEISPGRYDATVLAAQIRQLAQEVRDLTLSRPVTILNGESSSGGLSSYIMPAAAVGAMGYCYMWWKGWSFSDVMFVTKRNMANAVSNVSKQLEQVSAALASTKRHLSHRLEKLDWKLDEQKETSKLIMNEVDGVKTDLSQIGFDIESIQKMVLGLEGKIGVLEHKQDMTNAGVWYLCQVAGSIKDGLTANFFQEAEAKLPPAQSSLTFSEDKSPMGLQCLTESLKPSDADDSKPNISLQNENNEKPVKSTALHRFYPGAINLRKDGFVI
ncbi:uncharacterized protein LOC120256315 [Dioscorea cayenensis subsp. rotundata]|uniref:Uncharacterized protein LOC120256315 n=1 Tax=Dioscorea cayennensis subsp. rotundata TaxID=55577 RepID=A0AB40AYR1_DIOCR|nr:uncharacterized protein LOC120256315 [Dioscorea cayenensis subsp. rotundata]